MISSMQTQTELTKSSSSSRRLRSHHCLFPPWSWGYRSGPGFIHSRANCDHPNILYKCPWKVSLLLGPLINPMQPTFGTPLIPLLVLQPHCCHQCGLQNSEQVAWLETDIIPMLTLIFKKRPVLEAVRCHSNKSSQEGTKLNLLMSPEIFLY